MTGRISMYKTLKILIVRICLGLNSNLWHSLPGIKLDQDKFSMQPFHASAKMNSKELACHQQS
jgi:hypothetical protein